jgi:hypothetical protein
MMIAREVKTRRKRKKALAVKVTMRRMMRARVLEMVTTMMRMMRMRRKVREADQAVDLTRILMKAAKRKRKVKRPRYLPPHRPSISRS